MCTITILRFAFLSAKKKPATLSSEATTPRLILLTFALLEHFSRKKGVSKETSLQSAKSKQTDKTQEARILTDPTKFLKLLTKEEPKRKEWHC